MDSSQVKFYGQLPIYHISRSLFLFSKFSIFKFLWFFFIFLLLTWDHMEENNVQMLLRLQLWSDLSQNFMINKAAIREYKGINVLAICQKLKKNVALWNFNMAVNGQSLKCAISWKRLIVERNGRIFGTRPTIYYICRVLFMVDPLSSVWGHSVQFAKFLMLRFSKGYCSHSQFSFNLNHILLQVCWSWGI